VRAHAFAPYSSFRVGAAIMGASGRIYVGCNVENATYGATICAERAAICSMVANGETRLVAVAVYTEAEPAATPCGICRQVLAEFAEDAPVVVANASRRTVYSMAHLLPERFVLK
jgi:cytidine deaminase